jgi:hypothetical protein
VTRYALAAPPGRLIHARARDTGPWIDRSMCRRGVLLVEEDVSRPEDGARLCAACDRAADRRAAAQGKPRYACPRCGTHWTTGDAAVTCCGDVEGYEHALNNALFQCHGDHLHRMKSIQRKLAVDYGVRSRGVRWSDA